MTLRELHSALIYIDKRHSRKLKWNAALRGIKIDIADDVAKKVEFSEEEDALLSKQLKLAQERKRAELRGKNG